MQPFNKFKAAIGVVFLASIASSILMGCGSKSPESEAAKTPPTTQEATQNPQGVPTHQ